MEEVCCKTVNTKMAYFQVHTHKIDMCFAPELTVTMQILPAGSGIL